MFIKWRKYQRQHKGVKGDKYKLQPIIVESYRLGKYLIQTISPDLPDEAFDIPEVRRRVQQPRHKVIYKLPSYPACMVVYFRSPHWMGERLQWWAQVDSILEKLAELQAGTFTPTAVARIKTELELAVPRITPEEEAQLRVVLNDLPLQIEDGGRP
jgi:hypothetical protein